MALRNVHPLFDHRRARLAELRQWFARQAHDPAGYVATVLVSITGDGMVKSSGYGVEPEHAAVLLEELKGAVVRLEAIVAGEQPAPTVKQAPASQCRVMPLRRR